MARRSGYRIYTIDGVPAADPSQPITGDDGLVPPLDSVASGGATVAKPWAANDAIKANELRTAPAGDLTFAQGQVIRWTGADGTTAATFTATNWAAAAPTPTVAALDRIAATDAQVSTAAHRRDYEDGAVFNEQWVDMSAWTKASASDLSVSGGQVVKGSTSNFGARRALPVGTTGRFRIVGEVTSPRTGTGSGVVVGVTTSDDPNDLASWTAMVVNPSAAGNGDNKAYYSNAANNLDAGAPAPVTAALPAGTYKVVIVGDEQGVSFSLSNAARTVARRFYRTRAQVGAIKNVVIWNDSSAGTIGKIGARVGSPTISPRTAVESVAYTATTTKEPAGDGLRVELPIGYDSRVPAPVVVWTHGHGNTEAELIDSLPDFGKALLDAGFILVGTNTGGNTWGNQTALDKIAAAYRYVRDHYAISAVILGGQSMGALATFNALARRVVPAAAAMVFEPDLNLRYNRDTAAIWSDATLGPTFRAAYGIAADGSNYATATAGYDPMLQPASAFRGVPVLLASSPDDTLIVKTQHADLMAAKLAGAQRELDVVTTSGAHGALTQFPTVEPVAFAQRCVAA